MKQIEGSRTLVGKRVLKKNRENKDKKITIDAETEENLTIPNKSYVIDENAIKTLALGESADKINVALHKLDELEKVLNQSEITSLDGKENEQER